MNSLNKWDAEVTEYIHDNLKYKCPTLLPPQLDKISRLIRLRFNDDISPEGRTLKDLQAYICGFCLGIRIDLEGNSLL